VDVRHALTAALVLVALLLLAGCTETSGERARRETHERHSYRPYDEPGSLGWALDRPNPDDTPP
jgi:hypothetical protein